MRVVMVWLEEDVIAKINDFCRVQSVKTSEAVAELVNEGYHGFCKTHKGVSSAATTEKKEIS